MAFGEWKIVRSLRTLRSFLFSDLSSEEFGRLFGQDASEAFAFHLKEWDETSARGRTAPARFLSKARFLAGRILGQLSPARRLLFVLAFVLAVLSVFSRGNLPLYAFVILAFLLLLELTEKLLARDEIEIARHVQRSLFPQADPVIEGWCVASRNVPANDVGGDYFDYVHREDRRRLGVALGDVAGKGMGAALLVANLQATLRALLETGAARGGAGAVPPGAPPAETAPPQSGPHVPSVEEMEILFSLLNRALASVVQSNRFASLVYGELDRVTGRFAYVNAGQNPPLVVRADGAVQRLEPGGMVLGIHAGARYRADTLTLEPGDALVLYCDGVTERFDQAGNEFGEQRLVEVLAARRGRPADELRDAVLAAVAHHGGASKPHDDVTIVAISRDPGP